MAAKPLRNVFTNWQILDEAPEVYEARAHMKLDWLYGAHRQENAAPVGRYKLSVSKPRKAIPTSISKPTLVGAGG